MTVSIGKLNGVPAELRQALRTQAIHYSHQLLAACRTAENRTELAQHLNVEPDQVLQLAHQSDLARVHGIGLTLAELLKAAGVGTVAQLANQNPGELYSRLLAINAQRRIAKRLPSLGSVRRWVLRARQLGVILQE